MKNKAVIFIAAIFLSKPSWSACVFNPTYVDAYHQSVFLSTNQAIEREINIVDQSFSRLLDTYSRRIEQALATLSKQKAYSSKQIADVTRLVTQQVANALKASDKKTRTLKASFDYGPAFGQGYEPCVQNAVRQAMTARQSDINAMRPQRVTTEVMAGPGNYQNKVRARRALLDANRRYCTQDQVDSGLCNAVGGFPGAAVSVTTLFRSAPNEDPLTDAKNTFINNMVGLPDDEIIQGSQNAAQTSEYMEAKARKDALLSPAINSLKAIQLDYEGTEGPESGVTKSVAAMFDEEIKRYAGNSAEHDRWSSVLRSQSERGLMVELLRSQGLKLALQHKHYQQLERMEAVLASIVANEIQVSGLDAQSAAAADRASVGQKASSIR